MIFLAESQNVPPTHQVLLKEKPDSEKMDVIFQGYGRLIDAFILMGLLKKATNAPEIYYLMVNAGDLANKEYENIPLAES